MAKHGRACIAGTAERARGNGLDAIEKLEGRTCGQQKDGAVNDGFVRRIHARDPSRKQEQRPPGAGHEGGTKQDSGSAFMTCAGGALLLFPRWIARMYTPDETVIHSTILLLAAGAAFQLFDGIQTVATGAL